VATSRTSNQCRQCGRVRRPGEDVCGLCGHLFQLDALDRVPVQKRVESARLLREVAETAADLPLVLGVPTPWFYLGLGLLIAPLVSVLPIANYMGWFLASLVHEIGHCAAAWLAGLPAVPAIRLDGHAAAVHGERVLFLAAAIWGLLATSAWHLPVREHRVHALVAVGIGYPLYAFGPFTDGAFLLAGHAAELAFATLCLWRALVPGFTESPVERGAYSTLGWYLLGSNLFLTVGLVRDEGTRRLYEAGGSFGLTNDYVRVAHEVLGVPLEAVGALMTLPALAVLPLALWLAKRTG